MGRRAGRPAELAGRYFLGSEALRRGLLTPNQLRGAAWRSLFRDVYADAELPDSYRLRCEALGLVLPDFAAVTGRAAICLDGLAIGEVGDPIRVLVPTGRRFQLRGCQVRRAFLPPGHVRDGVPRRTVGQRSIWEIAGEPDLVEAVVVLDRLLHERFFETDVMSAWTARYPRSRATRALGLADGRADSPQESRMRVRLLLAGLPAPVPQFEVFTGSHFVARLDLAWPECRVGCEYDGYWHGDPRQFVADRGRLNRLIDAGWTIFHVTAPDLSDPECFARLCAGLRGALGRGVA